MRLPFAALFGTLVLALAGCGGSAHDVSGTVTLDGEPIPEGYIAFTPEGGGRGAGGAIKDGKYSVHVPAGKSRVEITASKKMSLARGQVGMYGEKEEVRQYIPGRYNATSELTANVPATDPLDFPLKSR
jgi:hypothetical protein